MWRPSQCTPRQNRRGLFGTAAPHPWRADAPAKNSANPATPACDGFAPGYGLRRRSAPPPAKCCPPRVEGSVVPRAGSARPDAGTEATPVHAGTGAGLRYLRPAPHAPDPEPGRFPHLAVAAVPGGHPASRRARTEAGSFAAPRAARPHRPHAAPAKTERFPRKLRPTTAPAARPGQMRHAGRRGGRHLRRAAKWWEAWQDLGGCTSSIRGVHAHPLCGASVPVRCFCIHLFTLCPSAPLGLFRPGYLLYDHPFQHPRLPA